MKEKVKTNRTAVAIVIGIIIAAAVVLEVLSGYLFGKGIKQAWDVCYPMANANISWEQTHYNGPWNGE